MNNNRLNKVLEYINKEDKLADVGCDHGFLAVEAIKKGVSFVQLIDNKEGPLQSAKKNLQFYEDLVSIEYSLSSGLSKLNNNVDTVAICGMGGELITQILSDDLKKARKVKKIILQANSKNDILRKFLSLEKFEITDESIVLDKGKIYEIIVARYNDKDNEYNDKDCIFGPILLKKKEQLFVDKWVSKLKHLKNILLIMDNQHKINEIKEEIKLIEEVLYESK